MPEKNNFDGPFGEIYIDMGAFIAELGQIMRLVLSDPHQVPLCHFIIIIL